MITDRYVKSQQWNREYEHSYKGCCVAFRLSELRSYVFKQRNAQTEKRLKSTVSKMSRDCNYNRAENEGKRENDTNCTLYCQLINVLKL